MPKKTLLLYLLLGSVLLLSACQNNQIEPTPARLTGEWVRISSNKPLYDSMRIVVEENDGRILALPDSNPYFQPGDLKWINIRPINDSLFSHEELGSDANYYPGSIRLHTNDSLTLVVEPEALGNRQVWKRL